MLNIREANKEDVDLIIFFVKELAIYEKEPKAAILTRDNILRDGFGDKPLFKVIIAEFDNKPVGFAFYFFAYSTWHGKPILFLEDLFVLPEYRKNSIGKNLLIKLAKIAVENNCCRFQWQVLNWNQLAIDFYNSIGANPLSEWTTYRLDGDNLLKLANL